MQKIVRVPGSARVGHPLLSRGDQREGRWLRALVRDRFQDLLGTG